MLWRPISRGSTVKVTNWLEEPSTLWGWHLEGLLWWAVAGLPDEQIPSTGNILTQNWKGHQWTIISKHFMIRKACCDCLSGHKLSSDNFTVLNNPLDSKAEEKAHFRSSKTHTQVALEFSNVKGCLESSTLLRNVLPSLHCYLLNQVWSYWNSLFMLW